MRQVALELIDRRSDKTGSAVRLDFDDERIGVIVAGELDLSVHGMIASDPLLAANRNNLETRHMVQQLTGRIHGRGFQIFR